MANLRSLLLKDIGTLDSDSADPTAVTFRTAGQAYLDFSTLLGGMGGTGKRMNMILTIVAAWAWNTTTPQNGQKWIVEVSREDNGDLTIVDTTLDHPDAASRLTFDVVTNGSALTRFRVLAEPDNWAAAVVVTVDGVGVEADE